MEKYVQCCQFYVFNIDGHFINTNETLKGWQTCKILIISININYDFI